MHSLIIFLLSCIVIISIITIYLNFKAGFINMFEKVLTAGVCVISVHMTHVLFCKLVFPDLRYLDNAAPYGFLYGAVLLFLTAAANGKKLHLPFLLIHFIPFAIAFVSFIILIFSPGRNSDSLFMSSYYRLQYGAIAWLLVIYVVYCLFFVSTDKNNVLPEAKRLLAALPIWLLLAALMILLINITGSFTHHRSKSLMPSVILFCIFLCCSCLVLRYTIHRLVTSKAVVSPDAGRINPEIKTQESRQYQKSAVTGVLLDEYLKKLNQFMVNRKVYLDAELSLDKLSRMLNIPKHHLTQLFNVRIGKSFPQYINEYRIEYALILLKSPQNNMTLEEMAFACGFNSKTSFNRNFKLIMGCTPSEYRS